MYGWEMKLDDFTIQLGVHMDPETQPEHTLTALQCDAGEERRHRQCEEVCGRHQTLTLRKQLGLRLILFQKLTVSH